MEHQSSAMDPEKKLQGREEDLPDFMFIKKVFQHQAYQGLGYGFEEPVQPRPPKARCGLNNSRMPQETAM